MRKYLKNHWAGQLGFGLTLFVNLIGLSFAVASVSVETLPDWVQVLAFVLILSILVWQVVGGLRCANTLQLEQSGSSNAWGVYLGVAVSIGLMGFQILDVLAHRFFIDPPFKTVFGNDDFSVGFRNGAVQLTGEVNYLMYQALLTILSQQESVKIISLDSHGGIVFAARSIAKLVEEKKLNTHVEHKCYSACTLILAAGYERSMARNAEVGFHGYTLDMEYQFIGVDPINEQKKDQAYLMARGIQDPFLHKAFGTDAKSLWKPTRSELLTAGFITEP